MRFFSFLLSHSIFIAFCAVSLCLQTSILLKIPHNINVYCLIFFSTLCSYNFYWLLSKFYFSKDKQWLIFIKNNYSYFILFIFSSIALLYFLFQAFYLLKIVIVSAILTFLYSLPLLPFSVFKHLQKWGFIKTIVLSFTWAFVTTLIPFIAYHTYTAQPTAALVWLFLVRFSFMLLLCILFDKRDTTIDKINGLSSLATSLHEKVLHLILAIVFVLYISTAVYYCIQYASALHAASFVIIGLLFIFLLIKSLKARGYVFYYFGIDGLMLLSGILSYMVSKL